MRSDAGESGSSLLCLEGFLADCRTKQPNNSPVTSVTSADMSCNVGGAKGVSGICEAKGNYLSTNLLPPLNPGAWPTDMPLNSRRHF